MFGNQIFEKQFFFSVFSFLSATAKIRSGIWFPPELLPRRYTPSARTEIKCPGRGAQRFRLARQVRVDWLWLPRVQA